QPIAKPSSTVQAQQPSVGVASASRDQRPSLDDDKASSAAAKVIGGVKGKEDAEEEPSAVRDTENDAAEEMEEGEVARTADDEETGHGAEGEEGAADGEGAVPVAVGNESGDEAGGVSEGKVISEAGTAAAVAVAADPSTTSGSSPKAGDGTAEGGGGETVANQAVQAEEEHSQAAGEGHGCADGQDRDEGREKLSGGREQVAGGMSEEEWMAEAETATEQVRGNATLATVSSSPAANASPVAGKDPPPAHLSRDTSDAEEKDPPQEAGVDGTAGDDTVVMVGEATGTGDNGDNYTGGPPQADAASEEAGPSAEVDDGIVSDSADTDVEQEAVTVERNAGDEHVANGDSGPEQELAAVPEIERAEADDTVVDEHDETGARGQELGSGESGGELNADVGREEAVVGKVEGGGIDDEPCAEAPEPEVTNNGDYVGEGSLGGRVSEDFFAGDVSSGEADLYPGAAAAAGGEALSTERDVADGDDGAPAGNHPPSPRIIATSLEAAPREGNGKRLGFPPSPVATQRKEAAAVGAAAASGDVGLSEAAKAAVEAALASAQSSSSARRSSRSSRKADDSSSKSRKKKKSHKERRRKDGGSKSGGEDGPRGVGGRRSGSVGPSDVESGREKPSSSKRHHRKSAV
ncbi:unnamed protein product, partial [Ectocarpus fasciculatus]